VEETYAQALELFRRTGESLPQLDLQWVGLGSYFIIGAQFGPARALAEQLLVLGQRQANPVLSTQGYRMLAAISIHQGDIAGALEHRGQALRLMESLGKPEGASDKKRLALAYERVDDLLLLCFTHLLRAQCREAWQRGHEVLELTRKLGHPAILAHALTHIAGACQLSRDVACTARWAHESLTVAAGSRFQPLMAGTQALRDWASVKLEGTPERLDALRRSIEVARKLGARAFMPYFLHLLADACLELGQVPEGLSTVDEALKTAQESGARLFEAELYRLQGELLRAAGNEVEARHSLLEARVVARRQQAVLFELRATVALARHLRDAGHPEEARRRLERIRGRVEPDVELADLRDSHGLLEAPA
jgi:tetratricopeptide (TPR) repeat protein